MSISYNFDWDPQKAYVNKEKHGVGFEEAATVFNDPMAFSIFDPDHSHAEDRWITMGLSRNGRVLVVCHTFQHENKKAVNIRIFSSRKANKIETKQYGE